MHTAKSHPRLRKLIRTLNEGRISWQRICQRLISKLKKLILKRHMWKNRYTRCSRKCWTSCKWRLNGSCRILLVISWNLRGSMIISCGWTLLLSINLISKSRMTFCILGISNFWSDHNRFSKYKKEVLSLTNLSINTEVKADMMLDGEIRIITQGTNLFDNNRWIKGKKIGKDQVVWLVQYDVTNGNDVDHSCEGE